MARTHARPEGAFRGYLDPRGHFSRRLAAVQALVRRALDEAQPGPFVILDVCGGEGRAVLPVVADHPRRHDVRVTVVDIDAPSIGLARSHAARLGLAHTEARLADAGLTDAYEGLARAHLVVLSGVFAHLSDADVERLLRFLPQVSAPSARLVWTMGDALLAGRAGRTHAAVVRAGFVVEESRGVTRWRRGGWRRHEVGLARLAAAPLPLDAGGRLFTFQPAFWERHPRLHHLLRPVVRGLRVALARPTAR